jgi:hypothetical protein
MKKLEKANFEIITGSGFSGIKLNVTLDNLINLLGQPTNVGSADDKVQLEWDLVDENVEEQIQNGEVRCITIYDWKTNLPIHKINQWNVGSKGLTKNEIHTILRKFNFSEKYEIIDETN